MVHYRFYLLGDTGRIFYGEDIQAMDDAAAIAAAQGRLTAHNASYPGTAHGVEIWCDRRLVFSNWTKP
jgi:hypothetical protein